MSQIKEMNEEQIIAAAEAYRKHQKYMKAYNKRPKVKARRSKYNKERWANMKAAMDIAKANGLIESAEQKSA